MKIPSASDKANPKDSPEAPQEYSPRLNGKGREKNFIEDVASKLDL